jgi:putative membrane protein
MPQRIGITVPLLRVWIWVLLVGVYSGLALLKRHSPFSLVPEVPASLDGALSFAMALIIAFRVNRAYERCWEARKLWGTLVNVSRNLAVKVTRLLQPDRAERRRVRDLIVAFAVGRVRCLRADQNDTDVRLLAFLHLA